jgi:hypothetical protein
MPILHMKKVPKKCELPSTANAPESERLWVVLDVSPLRIGDTYGFNTDMTQAQMGVSLLLQRIMEWNYTDEQGQAIPITTDTISWLAPDDVNFLRTKLDEASSQTGLTDEAKKELPSTSLPQETAITQPQESTSQ